MGMNSSPPVFCIYHQLCRVKRRVQKTPNKYIFARLGDGEHSSGRVVSIADVGSNHIKYIDMMLDDYNGTLTLRHLSIERNRCARRRYFLNEHPLCQSKINKIEVFKKY